MKKSAVLMTGLGVLLSVAAGAVAQAPATKAPAVKAMAMAEPQAPKPQADAMKHPFPPVNPKNFTAASPTTDEVNSFLKALWGYDQNRIWQVAAIEKTPAPGVAKVVVFIAETTQPGKESQTVFFTTPDGHHAIAGDVIDFGAKPFAATRALLQQQANGPSHGAKSDALELVEFADLQCPHCKEAQTTMDQLATDFPEAKIVFENFPLTEIHPYALQAAAEGACIAKEKGDRAFFEYSRAVFATQGALTPDSHNATLEAAALKAGADPKAAAACAALPATRDEVLAQRKLGEQIGVNQTPMLAVNGHLLPITEIPYETLKKIIAWQAKQDGITVHLQPTLSTLQ